MNIKATIKRALEAQILHLHHITNGIGDKTLVRELQEYELALSSLEPKGKSPFGTVVTYTTKTAESFQDTLSCAVELGYKILAISHPHPLAVPERAVYEATLVWKGAVA